MLKLEDIKKDAQIRGILPNEIVRVVQTEPVGDNTVTVYYKDNQGRLGEQMLLRSDEARLELAQAGRPWAFDADGADFKLGLEALRIRLAHLFDPMMAVHTANVEPLPHQISAVYEAMLPRQPLRFVLADDPGSGKTIMAGLLIRELLMRADAKRILIVAPGALTEQWQDEMLEKFGIQFEIFSREKQEQCASGNWFDEQDLIITRLDQLSRNEEYQEKLKATEWDLIVVDEAHKLSANYELSDLEAALYAAVTDYVRNEMNRADKLSGKKKNTVGFALTQLQRRLASSPEAIYQSLKRRRKRLV